MNRAHATTVPSSSYRLQFSGEFDLQAAAAVVDYLDALGLGAVYCSPLFRARAGSTHGYDVIDPSQIHPELGSEEQFRQMAESLLGRGMGVILDVVPNHMGITDPNNAWWQDVLENGPSSPSAACFDIDWNPPKQDLRHKVILPVLGDQFGRVLENQQLQVKRDERGFFVQYWESRYPLAPRSWRVVLRKALELGTAERDVDDPDWAELESIITSLDHLPPRTEIDPLEIAIRRREKAVAQRRIETLIAANPRVAQAIETAIEQINGTPGDPDSFDTLEAILDDQAYRLSYWRVAAEEINYRRFFDINDLAAVRVEEPRVFQAAHELMLDWMGQGLVTGLRIDHVDGLWDPKAYLYDLQEACRHAKHRGEASELGRHESASTYILVEKILGEEEPIPSDWPVAGTTGYEFLNSASGVFVDRAGARSLWQFYREATALTDRFADIVYESKQEIMETSMISELQVLARKLDRISEQHRYTRDFTYSNLQTALKELIASFPVYRTYIRPETGVVSQADQQKIQQAVRVAKRRNPGMSATVFDFLVDLLMLREPDGLTEFERHERQEFVRRFQQLTGPVTAKGLEDTAFYRVYPLTSLNEVGGHPWSFGTTVEHFHDENLDRLAHWPHSMLASSTHDTKRGEDTRARIHTLSEVPDRWREAFGRWQELSAKYLTEFSGESAPDVNEQYLFFQTLVGSWPLDSYTSLDDNSWNEYVERLVAYMGKAAKEAKINTSWLLQNAEHDEALTGFVRGVLDRSKSKDLLDEIEGFVRPLTDAGLCNSLAQLLLKVASPGVPDFYQGTELWQFTLVDPDNRRPVDYETRKQSLADMERRFREDPTALVDQLVKSRYDGRVKQLVTWKGLACRRSKRDLFLDGQYLPLTAKGPAADHVVAFARRLHGDWLLCVVPRLTLSLPTGSAWPLGEAAWKDTRLTLPDGAPTVWENVLLAAEASSLQLADLFQTLPLALLIGRVE